MVESGEGFMLGAKINVTGENQTVQMTQLGSEGEVNLQIPQESGEAIKIPLLEKHQQRNSEEDPPIFGEECNGILSLHLRWRVNPDSGTIQPASTDYRDIVRLPDYLRPLVYEDLLKNPHKQLPWPNRCTFNIQQQIQKCLKPSSNPTLRKGYFYLYKEGYLWRELEILGEGLHREISLKTEAGKDNRMATGIAEGCLHLPYKINGRYPVYEYAYSEIQWSWARINYFGGMDPKDPRILNNSQHYFPFSMSQDNTSPKERRSKRLCYFKGSEKLWNSLSRHNNTDTFITENILLTPNNKLPLLMVTDNLGLLGRQRWDLSKAWEGFLAVLGTVYKKPYYDSAFLAYHLYFGENSQRKNNANNEVEKIPLTPLPLYQSTQSPYLEEKNESPTEKASQYIDRDYLENYLAVKERKSLKAHIRELQKQMLGLLNDIYLNHDSPYMLEEYQQGSVKPFLSSENFSEAIKDYFSASVSGYAYGFLYINTLLALLERDPGDLDKELDLTPECIPLETQMGYRYLKIFLSKEYPLYAFLFPSEDDVNIYQPTKKKSTADKVPFSENDGTGIFRPIAFQKLYEASIVKSPYVLVETYTSSDTDKKLLAIAPDFLEAVVTGLLSSFKTVIPIQMSSEEAMKASLKLARATGDYNDFYLKKGMEGAIVGFENITHLPENTHLFSAGNPREIPVFQSEDNHPKLYTNAVENKGIPFTITRNNDTAMLENKLQNTYFIHLYKDSLDSNNMAIHGRTKKFIEKNQSKINSISAILTLINLAEATRALLQDFHEESFTKKSYEVINTLVLLAMTAKNFAEIFYGKQRFSLYINKHVLLKKALTQPYDILSMSGSAMEYFSLSLSFLSVLFSLKDTYANFSQGDNGLGVGQSVVTLGEGLLLASQAGNLVKQHLGEVIRKRLISDMPVSLSEEVAGEALVELSPLEAGLIALSPWELLAMGVIILGFILMDILRDDKLTAWAKHGPFGVKENWRFTGDYAPWAIPGNEKYATQSLLNIMMAPCIEKVIATESNIVLVSILLQQFFPGEDMLELHGEWQMSSKPLYADRLSPWESYTIAKPFKIQQVNRNEWPPRVLKMLYYFKKPNVPSGFSDNMTVFIRLRVRCREWVKSGNYYLPGIEFPVAHKQEKNDEYRWWEEGWIYGREEGYE